MVGLTKKARREYTSMKRKFTCIKCKEVATFNAESDGVYVVRCEHCGAENRIVVPGPPAPPVPSARPVMGYAVLAFVVLGLALILVNQIFALLQSLHVLPQ